MSQATTWAVPLVGPATPSVYAQRDKDSFDALLSAHRGSSRPSYAVAGTIWVKTIDATEEEVYIYDGTSDIYFGKLDLTNHLFLPANSSIFSNETGGAPSTSLTTIDAASVITESTWESVGPTSSGMDNIWTALDDVPLSANWIRARIYMIASSASDTAYILRSARLVGRKNGSSMSASETCGQLSYVSSWTNANGNAYQQDIAEATIPISSGCLDLWWTSSYNSSTIISIILVGWGRNA